MAYERKVRDDDEDTSPETIGRALGAIKAQLKERVDPLVEKQTEMQTNLLDVTQRLEAWETGRRERGGKAPSHGNRLGAAAKSLVDGLKNSNSARHELAFGIKDLSSTAPGALGDTQYAVPVQSLGPIDTFNGILTRIIDLMPHEPITSNAVQYVRIAYATNSPGGNQAAKAVELSAKNESELSTELVVVECPTIAHYVNVSRQVLADVPTLESTINSILTRGLLDKADAYALTDLITSDNHTAFTPGTSEPYGDAVARIASQLAQAGAASVVVCVNPADMLTMSLVKATGSGEYLGLPEGLPARIAQCSSVPVGHILAFEPGVGASYAERQTAVVEAGYTNDGFTKNRATLLSEARGMAIVRDKQRVAYGAIHS